MDILIFIDNARLPSQIVVSIYSFVPSMEVSVVPTPLPNWVVAVSVIFPTLIGKQKNCHCFNLPYL